MTSTLDRDRLFTDLGQELARKTVTDLAFLRTLRQLHEQGVTQTQLAHRVKVSQPAVSALLRRARVNAPDVRPGTHGGTAYEIAARYAAGELDRDTMVLELVGWSYDGAPEPNPLGDVDTAPPPRPGSFRNQVGRALTEGFLTDDDYDAVLDGLAGS